MMHMIEVLILATWLMVMATFVVSLLILTKVSELPNGLL